MNEIEKVSISGISFMLDQDAFRALNTYLSRLQAAYLNNPDGGEIIADIEARIAEIILARQNTQNIVDLPLVERIIGQLGYPEEEGSIASGAQPEPPKSPSQAFPRRLYRNAEGSKLGGVCSGIATFFDIDTVWVRLAMFAPLVLLILTSPIRHINPLQSFLGTLIGVVFLLYFILWMVVPMAKTPRQKLEMRGERITASSIESNLRQEFSAQTTPRQAQKSASVGAELFYTLGRIALFGLKAIALIVTLALVVFAMSLLVGIGAVLFSGEGLLNLDNYFLGEYLLGLSSITPDAYVTVTLLLMLIPVVLVGWLLFCLIFDRPLKGKFFSIAGGIWLILVIYWGIITVKEGTEFSRMKTEQWQSSPGRIEYVGEQSGEDAAIPADSVRFDTIPSAKQ